MKILKVHCNKCLVETKHDVIAEKELPGSEILDKNIATNHHGYEISWCDTYRMLECRGCESVSLQKTYWFSESEEVDEEFYPPRVARMLPDWHKRLPSEWKGLLIEVYQALQSDSRRLAMMGARALVDIYLNEKVGDIGGFARKLKKLMSDNLISAPAKEVLEAALDVGHAASHRAHNPEPEDVIQVIDIVENLLQQYTLESAPIDLKSRTPSRSSTF